MEGIKRNELMTNEDLIKWLSVLSNGYAKPDLGSAVNGTGTVRETKHYLPFIMSINSRLCELSGIACPDVKPFMEFKLTREEKKINRYG